MCSSALQFQTKRPHSSLGQLSPVGAGILYLSGSAPSTCLSACPLLGFPITTAVTAVLLPAAGGTAREFRGVYLGLEGARTGMMCCFSTAGTPALGDQIPWPVPLAKPSRQGRRRVQGEGHPAVRKNESLPGK